MRRLAAHTWLLAIGLILGCAVSRIHAFSIPDVSAIRLDQDDTASFVSNNSQSAEEQHGLARRDDPRPDDKLQGNCQFFQDPSLRRQAVRDQCQKICLPAIREIQNKEQAWNKWDCTNLVSKQENADWQPDPTSKAIFGPGECNCGTWAPNERITNVLEAMPPIAQVSY